MGFIESVLVCVGLFLLFPKGFKYLVGTWVGAMAAGFLWGLTFIAVSVAGFNPSWTVMGYTFLVLLVSGIAAGCILAARG